MPGLLAGMAASVRAADLHGCGPRHVARPRGFGAEVVRAGRGARSLLAPGSTGVSPEAKVSSTMMLRVVTSRGASQGGGLGHLVVKCVSLAALVGAGSLLAGCAAVYPEVMTQVREAPANVKLDPPPPDDLIYLRVVGADIPSRTRDGREWDGVGGKAPDPFVIVFVEDRELFRTSVQANTLRPLWRDQPAVNYRIPPRSYVTVELWDKNTMHATPICRERFGDIHDDVFTGGRDIACSSGARVRLDVAPARPKMGIGMRFEVRETELVVTKVLAESPASRAELAPGMRIVSVEGKPVAEMAEGEAKSLINANCRTGVTIAVLEASGATQTITLKDGPIYPVEGEGLALD